LGTLSRRALELNELNWWSNWARLTWLDKNTHLLASVDFPEPFFNRAGFLACRGITGSVLKLHRSLLTRGVSVFVVYKSCAAGLKALLRLGFRHVDTMSVMASVRAGPSDDSVEVSPVVKRNVEEWSRTYLLSFYGNEELLPQVRRVARRLLASRGVTLFEGRLRGRTAGVLAIYRSPGLAGVYCVGTLPEFRGKGVATTLLSQARFTASAEGRRLILQTLRSDHAEALYFRAGFRLVYDKLLMEKQR